MSGIESRHVIPVGEAEPEHRDDGFCWCQPTVEDVPPNGRIYIHRRWIDGNLREPEERG